MKYKAIISDIDGTLSPLTLHSQINTNVKDAVAKAQKKGIIFSLATGKPFYLVEHIIKELGVTAPVIVDNGAAIYDSVTQEPLWESVMDSETTKKVILIAQKYQTMIKASTGKESIEIGDIPQNFRALKVVVMGLAIQKAEEFIAEIEENLKNVVVVRAQSYAGDDHLDVYVTNPDATKQHAVLKFSEIVGVKTEDIIAIGDHYNDFPLFMACGLKVAMGNAVEDLKAIADYVAPSVDEDGVVDVIEKFVLVS